MVGGSSSPSGRGWAIAHPRMLLLLLLVASRSWRIASGGAAEHLAVLGYMPEYRHSGNFNYSQAFQAGLTHVIFFSLEVHPQHHTPTALDRLPPPEVLDQAHAAAMEHGGKLLLCFGGNARTGGFPTMVLTPESRQVFLTALDALLKEKGFDGVDYNWEYPNSQDEWYGLVALVRESRAQLLAGTALVTMAFYPDPRQYNIIRQFELYKLCDYIMSMTYDMHGRHSTMEFAAKTIADWTAHGLPPDKLALGVPFYGRDVKTGVPRTYAELVPRLHEKHPKSRSKRDSVDEIDGVFFNGRKTIKRKVELAAESVLGGIMIWELGQDIIPAAQPASLMSAIGEAKMSNGNSGSAPHGEL